MLHWTQTRRDLLPYLLLVQPHENVTAYAGGQMHLGFQVQLDTDHEGGVLELAVGVNRALEQVADEAVGLAGQVGHGHGQTGAAHLAHCATSHTGAGLGDGVA